MLATLLELAICASILFLSPSAVGVSAAVARDTEAPSHAIQPFSLGPFPVQHALTVYLVLDDRPASALVTIRGKHRAQGERLMVRAFDAAERTSYWRYLEPKPVKSERRGANTLLVARIPLQGSGVHQIRVNAETMNSDVHIEVSRQVGFGVCFQNGIFAPWRVQPGTMYAFVPPHAEELEVAGGPVRIINENGADLLKTKESDLSFSTKVPVSATGVVWQIDFPQVKDWKLRVAGFPFILCPTQEAARKIKASIEVLPDGTVVCWKFQRRIAQILPDLLSPEKVGSAQDLITPLSTRRKAWLREAEKNAFLLGPNSLFPSVENSLRNQNTDPKSHWGGSIGGWQERLGRAPPQDRWDRLRSIDGLWAGASPRNGAAAEHLAQAALLNAPLNPYFGKRELLYRAAAAALRDLMTLGEDEVWRGVGADMTDYPGYMCFPLGEKTLPVYARTAPEMPAAVRQVWTEALSHIIDRCFTDKIVTARNQSSFLLLACEDFAEGSADRRYYKLARALAKHFANGQSPAGYFMEACGPDASYTGITHWHMAVYYQQSEDPTILEALRKSYTFFNHTVAPEPDGSMLGGFNFNHRIGEGFYNEQWRGARGIADDGLPEVGLWADTLEQKTLIAQKALGLADRLKSPRQPNNIDATNIDSVRYQYWHVQASGGIWPAFERRAFIRNFGNELIAVKRPAYYAVVYVGKPAPVPFYIVGREKLRNPLPGGAENHGGEVDIRRVTPFLGGGLSMFWTPGYGSSVLATNWSPLTHHGLVAETADGKRYWEDYFSTSYRLDESNSRLTIRGRVEALPLKYERSYELGDQALGIQVVLTAEKDVTLARLQENIPLASGPAKSDGVTIQTGGEHGRQILGSRVLVHDSHHRGIEIDLDRPLPLRVLSHGLKRLALQSARIEIALPSGLKSGQTIRYSYALRGIRDLSI